MCATAFRVRVAINRSRKVPSTKSERKAIALRWTENFLLSCMDKGIAGDIIPVEGWESNPLVHLRGA